MRKTDCIFCKIAHKEVPAKIVFEDSLVAAFDDLSPQAPVHILVISKDHIERVSDLSSGDDAIIGRMIHAAKSMAEERGISESGYRLVFNCNRDAGQGIFHLHLHLLGGRKFSWPPG